MGLAAGVYKYVFPSNADKHRVFAELISETRKSKEKFLSIHRNWDAYPGVVLEEIIDQDDAIAKIHPFSVNGVRCTTIRVGDKIHLYHPWFKIGAHEEFIASGAIGTMDAGIDARTGIVDTIGFTEKNEMYEYHPDTGIKISGYTIPKWAELKELLEIIARRFPDIRYIGWDMALSQKGWCVMEANFGGEPLWQLMYERGMREELEELIGWKPEHEFWWQNK